MAQEEYQPICEIQLGEIYYSSSGLPFRALARTRYGLDCSVCFIVYTNLCPTPDYPANETWCLEESVFLKTFREKEQ